MIACIVPLVLIGWITPKLRAKVPTGITFFEYVQVRYGTYVNVYVTLTSLFYMFLFLSAEFTAVGQAVDLLSGTVPSGDLQGPGLAVVIGTSLLTMLYTSYGGLPISLATDKVQGVGMILIATLVTIAACTNCSCLLQSSWKPALASVLQPLASKRSTRAGRNTPLSHEK